MNLSITSAGHLTPEQNDRGDKLYNGGEYIADGYKGVLTQIRGDWEFLQMCFHYPRGTVLKTCAGCVARLVGLEIVASHDAMVMLVGAIRGRHTTRT